MYIMTEGLSELDAKITRKEQRCIHTDDWATIIRYARTNPWVYRKCMENGCTKSVEIKFPAKSKLYNINADAFKSTVISNRDGSHTVKYAVSIYGIRQDEDEYGISIGLTFGPATGEDYTRGYRCHTESGTKAAEIGDGISILCYCIEGNYRMWNMTGNRRGWPASRIRATLNGKDFNLDESVAWTDCLDTKEALISAFPEELREAIVPKAVLSDTEPDDDGPTHAFTTYDRLWLFSGAEIYRDTGSNNDVIRSNEGIRGSRVPYDRAVELGISTGRWFRNTGYDESGTMHPGSWWLRTLPAASPDDICHVSIIGDWCRSYASASHGLAPGFCIG